MRILILVTILFIIFLRCKNPPKIDLKEEISNPGNTVTGKETIDTSIINVWKEFVTIVKSGDYNKFRKFSFDSIEACDTTILTNAFIRNCFSKVFTDSLIKLSLDLS